MFNKYQLVSGLHTLRLKYTSEPSDLAFRRPIYMPSTQFYFPDILPDIRSRPETHPLARLNSLQTLTVIGHVESAEISKAIAKVSLKMEDAAQKEGKEVWKSETDYSVVGGEYQLRFYISRT